ncbi:MAG: 23S rRNA (guanosine(2251)-2'-O)-methyltransferase RlmB [Candidatus Binatia bacterium]|nr:23S rRNA (guanosine(2251)-2'-O)-methyltransferase RlmB [Candidatus Binatia bacterium]
MRRSPHGARKNVTVGSARVNRPRPDRAGSYLACGWHAAAAFLESRPDAVRHAYFQAPPSGEMATRLERAGLRAELLDAAALDAISGGVTHQGIILAGRPPEMRPLAELLTAKPKLLLALDGVTDPRNVGAIARSAEAAGFGGLILTRDRSPDMTPALVKTAAGATEYLPFCRVANLVRALQSLQKEGFWRMGLDADGDRDVLDPASLPGLPAVLVAGAEGKGLRPLVLRNLDCLLQIPLAGRTASLNVSVASGLGIFALARLLKDQT